MTEREKTVEIPSGNPFSYPQGKKVWFEGGYIYGFAPHGKTDRVKLPRWLSEAIKKVNREAYEAGFTNGKSEIREHLRRAIG